MELYREYRTWNHAELGNTSVIVVMPLVFSHANAQSKTSPSWHEYVIEQNKTSTVNIVVYRASLVKLRNV